MKIKIRELDETSPLQLHCRYDRSTTIQEVVVALDIADGDFTVRYNPEPDSGGVPESVHHRTALWWPLPAVPTAGAANRILAEVAPLAQEVLDGARIKWDGANHVGAYTDAAMNAEDRASQLAYDLAADLDEADLVVEVAAEDWWQDALPDMVGLTDEKLEEIVCDAERECAAQGLALVGAYEYLDAQR